MPSSPSVIQEFCAELGWRIDNAGASKVQASLEKFQKGAFELVGAMGAAAAATFYATKRMAEGMERLFYSSQRAASSVVNIKALEFGFRQIGLTATGAQSALENFGMGIRQNPGLTALLGSLGVATTDAHGKMRDTSSMMLDLVGKLKKMPFFEASKFGQMFGIDPATLFQEEKNLKSLLRERALYKKEASESGLHLHAAARASHEWMVALRDVGTELDVLWTKVSTALIERFLPAFQQFDAWFQTKLPAINSALDAIGAAFAKLGDAVGTALVAAFQKISKQLGQTTVDLKGIEPAIQAASVAIIRFATDVVVSVLKVVKYFTGESGLKPVLEAVLLYTSITWAVGMVTAIGSVTAAAGVLMARFAVLLVAIKAIQAFKRGLHNVGDPKTWAPDSPFWRGIPKSEQEKYPNSPLNAGKNPQPVTPWNPGSWLPPGQVPAPGTAGGWKLPVEPGAFTTAGGGLPPGFLHAVSQVESGGNPNAVSPKGAEGAFQFMPGTARQYGLANPFDPVASAYAAGRMFRDLLKHYGGNLTKVVAAYNWGSGNLDRDIRQHGAMWQNFLPKETHDYLDRVAGALSHYNAPGYAVAGGVTNHVRHGGSYNFKTDITVNGSKDAVQTARAIGDQQRRVHADIIRNTQGSIDV